jgi:hypothetical protein
MALNFKVSRKRKKQFRIETDWERFLQPFVLRELEQHIQAMHYVGIEGPVVEQMEARLKDDIEAEARKNEGRVLLHREEARSNVRGFSLRSKEDFKEMRSNWA